MTYIRILVVVLGLCSIPGYAVETIVFSNKPSATLQKFHKFHVFKTVNETGERFELDITSIITDELINTLEKRKYVLVSDASKKCKDCILLKTVVVFYIPGDAGKRWLIPGAGPTQLILRCRLYDAQSAEQVADIVVAHSVDEGGLFTAGADQWILGNLPISLIDEIEVLFGHKKRSELQNGPEDEDEE